MFDKIHDAHIEKGPPGRDIMQKYLATKYANVTTEQINIYRSFCEKCGLKKSKARRGVVKPILTQKEERFITLRNILLNYIQY